MCYPVFLWLFSDIIERAGSCYPALVPGQYFALRARRRYQPPFLASEASRPPAWRGTGRRGRLIAPHVVDWFSTIAAVGLGLPGPGTGTKQKAE